MKITHGKVIIKLKKKHEKVLDKSARASIAYTFSNLLSKGISIITVPLFTRIMSTSEVGISSTYSSWYAILYAVITLSLTSGSVNIAMLDYTGKRDQYESSVLTLSTISGSIFFIIYLFEKKAICDFTTLGDSIMVMLCLSMIINPALDLWYARQRYEYKYKSSVLVSTSLTILSAICALLAVIFFQRYSNTNLGMVKILSQGSVQLIFGLVAYLYILIKGKDFFDLSIWKYALKLSLPLIVHTLSKNILDLSDRLMISSMCGQSDAGIYGTLYSLASVSLLVWNAINASLIPTMFEKLNNKEYTSINFLLERVLVLFGVATVGITLLSPEILMIVTTPEYASAVYTMPALSAGIYMTALYNIYGNILLFKKKTLNIMIATSLAAGLNILLNYTFIGAYGYIAASYTTFISFVLLAVLQGIMVRIVFKKPILNDKRLFFISIAISVICMISNFLYNFTIIRYVLCAIIVFYVIFRWKNISKLSKKGD